MRDGGPKNTSITRAYLANQPRLERFISRFVRSPHDVEDISQEAFMRAFRAERKTEISNPTGFLFRTAKNIALNQLTRKSKVLTDYIEEKASPDVLSNEKSVEDQHDDKKKFELFCEALETLPPQCQRVFVMRKVFGYSQKEISKAMNISQSTVEKHISAGLKRTLAFMLERSETTTIYPLHGNDVATGGEKP